MRKLLFSLSLLLSLVASAEISPDFYEPPLRIPLVLSGNFGELRSNHFHSGIDFKTQGVVGKPIYAVADGYVSRINLSVWGYGLALYLNHPNGTTSVYAHLDKYVPEIEKLVRILQKEDESFSIDRQLAPDVYPVKKGELIAYSGNTGSSGGPHLHFELRDTHSERIIDPLPIYKSLINDTRPPKARMLLVNPIEGSGVVNGNVDKVRLMVNNSDQGKPLVKDVPQVWGNLYMAVKANDYMSETTNIYGVRSVKLFVDEEEVFHSEIAEYGFDETRYINSLTDYVEWKKLGSWFYRSYREPGNKLPIYTHEKNRGVITIDEERLYNLRYELEDLFGNKQVVPFQLKGVRQSIPAAVAKEGFHLLHDQENYYTNTNIRFTFPQGVLYDDDFLDYIEMKDSAAVSDTHRFRNYFTPLHSNCQLSLRLRNLPTGIPARYYIADVTDGGSRWVGGRVERGWITANVRTFGDYCVKVDTVSPIITPKNIENAVAQRRFTFGISDNDTGVKTYRGTIDGKWVLFECSKGMDITYKFNRSDMETGKVHTLLLEVEDQCGNITQYTKQFNW